MFLRGALQALDVLGVGVHPLRQLAVNKNGHGQLHQDRHRRPYDGPQHFPLRPLRPLRLNTKAPACAEAGQWNLSRRYRLDPPNPTPSELNQYILKLLRLLREQTELVQVLLTLARESKQIGRASCREREQIS